MLMRGLGAAGADYASATPTPRGPYADPYLRPLRMNASHYHCSLRQQGADSELMSVTIYYHAWLLAHREFLDALRFQDKMLRRNFIIRRARGGSVANFAAS